MKALVLLVLLALMTPLSFTLHPMANATHDPKFITLIANQNGWNSTVAGAIVNPPLTEFRSITFRVRIVWQDSLLGLPSHNFAIYPPGYASASVFPGNPDALNRTADVDYIHTTELLTTRFTVPKDDFTGPANYEYFCEYHPQAIPRVTPGMHGKLQMVKNPDLDGNGKVDILDAAALAFAFDATPTSPQWNLAADINNNGRIDIVDAATLAAFFDKSI